MSKFFIDHPIFAWVVAILISLSGVISILGLGVESYPDIAPPQVTVNASYPGASAEAAEKAVTQVIEQQLTGIDHLLYFTSSSSSSGSVSVTLTFETGTDADIAQELGLPFKEHLRDFPRPEGETTIARPAGHDGSA